MNFFCHSSLCFLSKHLEVNHLPLTSSENVNITKCHGETAPEVLTQDNVHMFVQIVV